MVDIWDQDRIYTRQDWQHEITEGNTQRGYWSWVASQYEQKRDEADRIKKKRFTKPIKEIL